MEAQHVLVFSIILTFLFRTRVFAANCPSTDTSSVVQVCTSRSITGSYLRIDTRNVSSSTTVCSCNVSLGGNNVQYIDYSGPGTSEGGCGIEFRFNNMILACQSTIISGQTVNGIKYSQTNNPVSTACLSMRIDGNATITCYESVVTLLSTQTQSSTPTTTTRTTTTSRTRKNADIDMMTTNIHTQGETTELGKSSNQIDIGDTVGGILGGLVGIVLLAVLITICVVKRNHLNKKSHDTPSQSIDGMATIPDSDLEKTMTTNRVYENLVI